MWWSEAQMIGMDLDSPPSKTAEIQLDRWEYGDPIGNPNPATFNVVALVSVPYAMGGIALTAQMRWLVGPLTDRSAATWTEWEDFVRLEPARVPGTGPTMIQLGSVALRDVQMRLYTENLWPHAFETQLQIYNRSNEQATAITVSRRLEILPGD